MQLSSPGKQLFLGGFLGKIYRALFSLFILAVKMLWLSMETHHMCTTWSCKEAKHDYTVVLVRKRLLQKVHVTFFLKCTMFPHCYVFLSSLNEYMSVLIFDMYFLLPENDSYISPRQYMTFIHLHFLHTRLVQQMPHNVQWNLPVYHNGHSNSKVSKQPSWMYSIWKMYLTTYFMCFPQNNSCMIQLFHIWSFGTQRQSQSFSNPLGSCFNIE